MSEESPCCTGSEAPPTSSEAPPTGVEPLIVEQEISDGQKKVKIAVVGCSHGEMDLIYDVMSLIEKEKGYKFDLLICCGDYQSVRNHGDLLQMSVPPCYRSLQTFYKYYSGEKTAPVLTLFIGGNHEASGYLSELPNGGWVAPNIYYMGFANCIRFAGLRIAGLSGIYAHFDAQFSHFERPPFADKEIKSAYHTRNVDVFRLRQLKAQQDDKLSNPIDIMFSHDWPCGIPDFGDKEWLWRKKDRFEADHNSGKLGNPSGMKLIYDCRPRYYLAAHLHIAFKALVPHKGSGTQRPAPTKFLSLDKPIPGRHFMQTLEINVPADAKLELSYDPQWLAVLKSTDKLTIADKERIILPDMAGNQPCVYTDRKDFRPTEEEMEEIGKLGDLTIKKDTFRMTAPPLKQVTTASKNVPPSAYYRNPQSAEFCQWLGIRDLNQLLVEQNTEHVGVPYYMMPDDEIQNQDDVDFGEDDFVIDGAGAAVSSQEAEQSSEPEAKKFRSTAEQNEGELK